MGWWNDKKMRLIQNNFIDLNVAMDVDQWIRDLKSFECTVALVGVGGITSYYPTSLPYQVVSPYLPEGRDLIREIIDKCHAAGIRVMGRFDFGRAHEKFLDEHPEWFYHSASGELLRVVDTVTTCVSGYYQQEYSKIVVKEALERYPDIDGIFFNAFGFAGWDYHGVDHGFCHCENCKRQFKDFSGGMELPEGEDDPAMPKYREYQRYIVAKALHGMQDMIRSFDPNICLSTYSPDGVDIIKSESNSGVGRTLPFPLMNSSFNIAASRHVWPDRPMANCVINATDLRWRYAAVSPHLTQIRLYENIAAGGFLDFCINGVFTDYPDQASLEPAREVFRYHAKNEKYYGNLCSQAKAVLVVKESARPIHSGSDELFGMMKALKEEHILFDIQSDTNLVKQPDLLSQYAAVIIPDIYELAEELVRLVRDSGKELILSAINKPLSKGLEDALRFQLDRVESDNAGAYLETRQKDIFTHFSGKNWVFVTHDVGLSDAPGYEALLPYVEKGNFGPAERAYGYRPTDTGTILRKEQILIITWALGTLYQKYGYQDHKYILADLLDAFCPEVRVIRTNAHPSVELFWDACGEDMLLQALNLSGFNGMTVEAPVPMDQVSVTVPCKNMKALPLTKTGVTLTEAEDGTVVTFDRLNRFAAVTLSKA